MILTRDNVERQLAEFREFMKTSAYSSWKFTQKTDLQSCKESIVLCAPDTEDNRAHVLKLHGQKDALEQVVISFEVACDELQTVLDKMVEAGTNVIETNQQEQTSEN